MNTPLSSATPPFIASSSHSIHIVIGIGYFSDSLHWIIGHCILYFHWIGLAIIFILIGWFHYASCHRLVAGRLPPLIFIRCHVNIAVHHITLTTLPLSLAIVTISISLVQLHARLSPFSCIASFFALLHISHNTFFTLSLASIGISLRQVNIGQYYFVISSSSLLYFVITNFDVIHHQSQ